MPSITEDELGRVTLLLDRLGYDLDPSILIGGWATQMRVGGDVSRDIDLIINDLSLRQKLRELLPDYSENTLHSKGRKGRGTLDGVHIDAYIPYESLLGNKLLLEVDKLTKYTEPAPVKGWLLLDLHAHTATKIAALLDRPHTEKGAKDAREVTLLLKEGAGSEETIAVLIDATAGDVDMIPAYITEMFELLPDLAGLNKKDRRWAADLRREWIDEAQRQVRRSGATQWHT